MAFAIAESEWDPGASIGTITKGMLFYRGALLEPLNNTELFWDELLHGAANLTDMVRLPFKTSQKNCLNILPIDNAACDS